MKRDFEDPLQQSNSTDKKVHGPSNGKEKAKENIPLLKKGVVLTTFFLLCGSLYWSFEQFVFSKYESTDNAYIAGDINRVSTYVNGILVDVYVEDNDYVEEGEVLALLDPTDSILKLEQSKVSLTRAIKEVVYEQYMLQTIATSVEASKLVLDNSERTLSRLTKLSKKNNISKNELDDVRHEYAKAKLDYKRKIELYQAKKSQLNQEIANHPKILEEKANYVKAWLENERRVIKAPISGYITQSKLEKGQHLSIGQPLLSIVPLNDLWVEANFKENQLHNITIGQRATIYPDIFDGETPLDGVVVGISPTTGSLLSLLPPENATGNWVKVVQRLPVRIRILSGQVGAAKLKLGLSTSVKIHMTDAVSNSVSDKQNESSKKVESEQYISLLELANESATEIIKSNLAAYVLEQPFG